MMKIAIWGYGKYGHRMFESLSRFCSEEYQIIRVYDTDYRKLKHTEGVSFLQIHDPQEILEDYKKGLFEKILLCIFNKSLSRGPKQFLKEHFIPELQLGNLKDFYPVSSFEQGEKPFEINREGYDFYVVKNLYGAMANYESAERLYLFDDKGRVVKEHKDILTSEFSDLYGYPFVFRHSNAEKIYLEGQYCVLTKQYSGNYWHFTYNNLEIVWLLEKAGFQGKYVIPDTKFSGELLQMLDISPERIVSLKEFEHNKIYVFEKVFYVIAVKNRDEDFMYGSPVLLEAADYIKKKLPVNQSFPKKIYVKRIGQRKLLGADDIVAEYGFTTLVPENYSLKEQMAFFYNADIVFCAHGANCTNSLYMRKGTVFIEAFSSYWMQRCFLYTVAAAGIHYLPISPLETVLADKDGMSKDFKIPKVLLRMTIQNAFLISQKEF